MVLSRITEYGVCSEPSEALLAARLSEIATQARGDILAMTTMAASGHLGGSLSSVDILAAVWSRANVSPTTVDDPGRDRVVVSHGHIAPAVYAVLGRLGYFDPKHAICLFRRAGSPFEGHASPEVPGVDWACGNLGQGLSAACGFALASGLTGNPYRVYCVMGDGEQQKGQIAEARRFAVKHKLVNLTAVIDCNGLQAMGSVSETMPQDLSAEWAAAGWRVLSIDGHDHFQIFQALAEAERLADVPTVVLAWTVMGKGVPDIEDRFEYHGKVLRREQCAAALAELGLSDDRLSPALPDSVLHARKSSTPIETSVVTGMPRTYSDPVDCRTAFGKALADLAQDNATIPMAVFDCDLSASVKTDGFAAMRPDGFVQCGIQEHCAATVAGAVSKSGVLSFFADFGVFGIDETYNQHRLNDINCTSLKLVCTHCGLDVGEDGKTHQCIDYISLAANLNGFQLIIPADANHADRAVRYIASTPGRFILAMGRSGTPIIRDEEGAPLYGDDYELAYGRADWVRSGDSGTIITAGSMVAGALDVRKRLIERGLHLGILNLSCPLEIDRKALNAATNTGLVVTYEDHGIRTGMGSLVGAHLAEQGARCRFMRIGVTKYGVSGSPDANYRLQGLDAESAAESIVRQLMGTVC